MRESRSIFSHIDWVSLLLCLLLMVMGWINIYAAAYDETHNRITDLSQEYGKQMLWIFGSVALGVLVLFLDGRLYEKLAFPIYFTTLVFLGGVLLFGTTINGARSWYALGNFNLQPTEFMKFATALAVAKLLADKEKEGHNWKVKLQVLLLIVSPVLLILPQPDLGSAIVYSAFLIPLDREGMPAWIIYGLIASAGLFIVTLLIPKFLLLSILTGLAFVLILLLRKHKTLWTPIVMALFGAAIFVMSVDFAFNSLLEDRHRNRINIMLGKVSDPKGIGYNTHQSLIAIGSGGLSGKGFLEGTQTKYNFVPAQTTDFIFCTVGEEWGFLGSAVVILLFGFLFFRLIYLAERQRSSFSRIYGYSVVAILFLHFAVNIAMTIGLAPVIGIPLPFFSYGGSSLWGFTLLVFIFLRLDAYRMLIL